MSIINDLYDGKIYPAEQIVPKDPKYTKNNREIDAIMMKLQECLDKSQYAMVEEVCDLLTDSQDIHDKEIFRYALSLGLQIMQEAYKIPFLPQKKS